MSVHIPQISVDKHGNLVPNLYEKVISLYKPVEHDGHEGELYITDFRLVWLGSKSKGGFLGKVAKAAIIIGAVGAGVAIGGRGSRRIGLGPMMGGGLGGLGMSHMVSRNQQGQPQTVSLPYEVATDVQAGDDKMLNVATQAGSLAFRFRNQGDAIAAATLVNTQKAETLQKLSASKPSNQQPANYPQAPPPQYVPPPPPSEGFHYCSHCGTPLEPGTQYCHNCGERLH